MWYISIETYWFNSKSLNRNYELTCIFMLENWRRFWKISLWDNALVVGERRFDLFSDKANIALITSAAFSSKWLAQAWIIDSFLNININQ